MAVIIPGTMTAGSEGAPDLDLNSTTETTSNVNNSNPVLYAAQVKPRVGWPDTIFRYRIKYRDAEGDAPAFAKIYIDNISHTLSLNYSITCFARPDGGLVFEFDTRLPVGDHEYFFRFKDDNGSAFIHWPETQTNKHAAYGPIVRPFDNNTPILSNGSVTPILGDRFNVFNYTITYFDVEADPPTSARVVIDGAPHQLTQAVPPNPDNVKTYFFETELSLGKHYYHFEFAEHQNMHYIRYPSEPNVEFFGPIVVDLLPQLSHGLVTPSIGTTETEFRFSILYEDFDNDVPVQAQVIIDNRSFNLMPDLDGNANGPSAGTGLKLSHSTNLEPGLHHYYYLINSGNYIIRYPSHGHLTGPHVQEIQAVSGMPGSEPDMLETSSENPDTQLTPLSSEAAKKGDEKDQALNADHDALAQRIEILGFGADLTGTKSTNIKVCTIVFKLSCWMPVELVDNCKSWVYIDGIPYQMPMQQTSDKNVIQFTLQKELSSDWHYYHFILKTYDTEIRVPNQRDVPVLNLNILNGAPEYPEYPEEHEEHEEPAYNIHERASENQVLDILQVSVILILIFSAVYILFLKNIITHAEEKDPGHEKKTLNSKVPQRTQQ